MKNAIENILEHSPIHAKKKDTLMNRKIGAAYIGITPGTMAVYDCTKQHDFQPVRIGGRVYYWKSVLDAWLLNQLQP